MLVNEIKQNIKPNIAIIILNYNSSDDTIKCLSSLRTNCYPSWQAIIVDNASSNDSVHKIITWCEQERWLVYLNPSNSVPISSESIVFLTSDKNLGYAGGNNIGIKYALKLGFDLIFVLNNDTIVARDCLNILVDFIERTSDVGFVGPVICEMDQPDIIQSAGAKIDWFKAKFPLIDHGHSILSFDDYPRQVDAISGAAMLVKSKVLKTIGLLDDIYFLYVEEVDWCWRAKKMGFSSWVVPQAKVWHKTGASSVSLDDGILQYYRTRNRLIFMRKHASLCQWLIFFPYLLRHTASQSLKYLLSKRPKQAWLFCRAIIDGIKIKLKNT